MNDVEIAWLAGLLEGEGCFHLGKGGHVQIKLSMTDADVVQRAARLMRVESIYCQDRADSKPLYTASVHARREVARVLLAVYPLMGERRRSKIADVVERGNWTVAGTKNAPIRHGTATGYIREWKAGQTPCDACRLAMRDNQRERRARRAASTS